MGIFYTIQSANREFSVPIMNNVLKEVEHYWVIPRSNYEDYSKAGAKNIILVDGELPMKSKQLNISLEFAFDRNQYCVTMDDDYISSNVLDLQNNKKKSKHIEIIKVVDELHSTLENSNYYLAGVPSNTNPFYANNSISKKGMISGQFMVHKPQEKVRFDESVAFLEDFDYVINHHITYGGLDKHNRFLINYHMINRGKFLKNNGVGGYDLNLRKEQNLLCTIDYISKKWNNPNLIIEYNGFGKSLHKKVKWSKLKSTI